MQLRKKIRDNSFCIKTFYKRRIKRLFPSLLVVLFGCTIFAKWVLFENELKLFSRHVLSASLFVQNFNLISEISYFDPDVLYKPVLHLWSLSLEEQFYFIWPILLLLVYRRFQSLNLFVYISTATSFVFFILLLLTKSNSNFVFYFPLARFWEIGLGACLATLTKNKQKNTVYYYLSFMVMVIPIALGKYCDNQFFNIVFATYGAAGLIYFYSEKSFLSKFLCSKILVGIGLISYPLYLIHWPVISFRYIIYEEAISFTSGITVLFFSTLLAVAIYRCFEKPLRFSTGKKSFYILVTAFIFVSCYNGVNVIDLGTDKVTDNWSDSRENLDSSCLTFFPKQNFCLWLNQEKDNGLVVLGDSHSQAMFWSISNSFANERNILLLGMADCPPFLEVDITKGYNRESCRTLEASIRKISKMEKITSIVLHSEWLPYLEFQNLKSRTPSLKELSIEELFYTGLEQTIDLMIKNKKKVFIVSEIPNLNVHPRNCLRNKKNPRCYRSIDKIKKDEQAYWEIIRKLQEKYLSLRVIDIKDYLCDDKKCRIVQNDRPLYRDWDHLNIYGQNFLSEKFRQNRLFEIE